MVQAVAVTAVLAVRSVGVGETQVILAFISVVYVGWSLMRLCVFLTVGLMKNVHHGIGTRIVQNFFPPFFPQGTSPPSQT